MTSFPSFTIEGYPRVGANRELKKALESFWAGRIDEETFTSSAHSIRLENYARLRDLGLDADYAIPADVALYDHVLETSLTVGLIGGDAEEIDLAEYFALARGNAERSPLEMTKWFDTNYHYLVPEVADSGAITPRAQRILDIVAEAKAAGHVVRPYLVGPVTLLAKSKPAEGAGNPLNRLAELTEAYKTVLAALKEAGVEWVQLAEPALVSDLTVATDEELAQHAADTYAAILGVTNRPQVLISTPYGSLRAGLEALAQAGPEALHVDLAPATLAADAGYAGRVAAAVKAAGKNTVLVAGVIDGRNVWAADLRERLSVLEGLKEAGVEKLAVSSSVSLLHVPHTVAGETSLPVDVAGWLSFADEKIGEAKALSAALAGGTVAAADDFARSDRAVRTRTESARTHNEAVQARVAALPAGQVARQPEFAARVEAQKALNLPKLPTTTIGSFPQTAEIRKARADHRTGVLNEEQYTEALKDEVKSVIELQERLGLDVLVHGEPERNDMVQYFAELLDGFVVTENGWVQSYGSRCTRPPIVVGDVSRPEAMTVEWAKYAQSLSEKHVKGMLTGPVTILAWSFVRDDVPLSVSADQIGVALADEVADLEEAGIEIIQIDEPALRELLPLREDARPEYLDWAVRSFRLVAIDAKPTTQIHTHLCYSEFGQIIDAVAALDADVTSIEAARSRMELLEDLEDSFHSEIGPGIWDIHSPRVPSVAELTELIKAALVNVPTERLWVNPDCGLKTRGYAETEQSLRNMVLARDIVVESL
ncbi:5-methyltetrahydropteroyltriglutamate--homocysteine S-methyltransferase [Corynebacterium marinum]|uniref:5-methyltetrahydropteroyltriglutamate--homocysteine S-methyltransferase n=1 Tax=Corynebacterium marinum DSM 44953 TaxID=1224162 RepID=A0A0B6TN14_9CORY|nr:5-methyltetrahydropteroyltriglutamate--homocysteine S-methyltransferase [Corynebacterium marinum]AJK67664.1 5-methyltetrahydropteroyltriglutamate-homocysteine methyltransferase [Corynebacterium marinum DSM 44953]GGO13014.1 5-methyltetrahydropteroyltriglutamate--homocysteine methyltransferase [Corynebacterium marinum]